MHTLEHPLGAYVGTLRPAEEEEMQWTAPLLSVHRGESICARYTQRIIGSPAAEKIRAMHFSSQLRLTTAVGRRGTSLIPILPLRALWRTPDGMHVRQLFGDICIPNAVTPLSNFLRSRVAWGAHANSAEAP